MKKVLSFILVFTLVLGVFAFNGSGKDKEATFANSPLEHFVDAKIYSEATINDDFADSTVMVVLNGVATRNFKNYSTKDFLELELESVTELTLSTDELLTIESRNKGTSLEINIDNYRRILKLELSNQQKESVLAAIRLLEKRDDIIYAGPDFAMEIFETIPNDPYFPGGGQSWGLDSMSIPNAWDITTGSQDVIVGVVDSGIDSSHPDLTNQIYRESPHNISNTLHSDFLSGNRVAVLNPTDPRGHGTHVAGIIGAEGDNGVGIAGTAWSVSLVSLRVFDANGNGNASSLTAAINFATQHNIPILNFSGGSKAKDNALEQAIKNYPGLFVAAAGNDGEDNDITQTFLGVIIKSPVYPASYQLDNLISVGAVHYYLPTSFTNYGKKTVDLFAHGYTVLSTFPTDKQSSLGVQGYDRLSGTSMSTPFVTGAAALILAKHHLFGPKTIKKAILDSVDLFPVLSDLCVTGGRLNVYEALNVANTLSASGQPWEQPAFASQTNIHGTVTSSGVTLPGEDPWRAFDGIISDKTNGTYHQWTQNIKSGWIELQLNYYIKVYQIDFYQRVSSTSNYTKDAYFTGTNGVALGAPFRADNHNLGKSVIPVGNVVTNVIRLDVESSYGSYIGANEIIIHATTVSNEELINCIAPVATVSGNFDGDSNYQDIAKFYGYGSTTFIAVWSYLGSSLVYRGIWWYSAEFDVNRIKGRVVAGNFQGNANGRDTIIVFYENASAWTDAFFFTYDWSGGFNNGTDMILIWRSYSFGASDITDRVVSGDFDGDGQDEIIAFHDDGGNNISAYMFQFDDTTNLLNGGSSYWPPIWLSNTFCAKDITGRVVAGDFDGDGRDEIITFHDDGGNTTTAYMFRFDNGVLNDGSSYWPPVWSSNTFCAKDITGRIVSGNFQGNANGREDIIVFYDEGAAITTAYFFSFYASTGLLNDGSIYWPPVWSSQGYAGSAITDRIVGGNFTNNGKDEIIAFYFSSQYSVNDAHIFSYNHPNLSWIYC